MKPSVLIYDRVEIIESFYWGAVIEMSFLNLKNNLSLSRSKRLSAFQNLISCTYVIVPQSSDVNCNPKVDAVAFQSVNIREFIHTYRHTHTIAHLQRADSLSDNWGNCHPTSAWSSSPYWLPTRLIRTIDCPFTPTRVPFFDTIGI